jgi:hypothetical protein
MGLVPLYRFFAPGVGHFYTTNYFEGQNARYGFERTECRVQDQQTGGAVPLYRFRHGTKKTHFYTINRVEFDNPNVHSNYAEEGIQCYVWPAKSSNLIALHRYYNPDSHDHFYTTWIELRNSPQWDHIMNGEPGPGIAGYKTEGVACWVVEDSSSCSCT